MDTENTAVMSGTGYDKGKLDQFMTAIQGLIAGRHLPVGMRFKTDTPHANKFKPHQGAKEIARRKRQLERSAS